MQVTVQLHVVQTWDAAVRLVLAVCCANIQGGDGGGEGLEEAEAQRLYIGSSLSSGDSGYMMEENVQNPSHSFTLACLLPFRIISSTVSHPAEWQPTAR